MSLKKIVAYHLIALVAGIGLIILYSLSSLSQIPQSDGWWMVDDLLLLFFFLMIWVTSLVTFILINRINNAHKTTDSNSILNWQRLALFTTSISVLIIFPGMIFIRNPLIPIVIAIVNLGAGIGLGIKAQNKKLLTVFSIFMSAVVILATVFFLQ